MNDLSKEKTMTIKEIADHLQVNEITVRRQTNELYPDKIKNGITTHLNQIESENIVSNIRKKGLVIPRQKVELDLNEIMKSPEFFRKIAAVIERNNYLEITHQKFIGHGKSTNFRDTSNQIGLKQNDFIHKLINDKYIYKNVNDRYRFYSQFDNYFEYKDFINDKSGYKDLQILITFEGKELFNKLYGVKK